MVLASLVHYPERIRCGVDVVGISNFVSFLENTKPYRRQLRRNEYGDERDPDMRAFLESISPLSRADEIRADLLVIQGANDPRVPVSESRRIVERLRELGREVWYLEFDDEGHGLRMPLNLAYAAAVGHRFAQHCLEP
jgi:dipeptidyl aminopeptidase/acylaminoacyl peptidase